MQTASAIPKQGDSVVLGTTCFNEQAIHGVNCQRKACRHWVKHKAGHNCILIAAKRGGHTLQEIGEIYNLTRMRICQIEKGIIEKVRNCS